MPVGGPSRGELRTIPDRWSLWVVLGRAWEGPRHLGLSPGAQMQQAVLAVDPSPNCPSIITGVQSRGRRIFWIPGFSAAPLCLLPSVSLFLLGPLLQPSA